MNRDALITDFFFGDEEHIINEKILDDIDYIVPKVHILSYIRNLISIPYSEFLYKLISWNLPPLTPENITQTSTFSAAEIEMCHVLIENNNLGFTNIEIGQLFPQYCKTLTPSALRKYGENQAKTSQQLGLTFLYYGKWYLNCFGYVYEDLSEEERLDLLARTILRDPLYGSMMKDLLEKDIYLTDYMLDLSRATICRRAQSIVRILNIGINCALKEGIDLNICHYEKPKIEKKKNKIEKVFLFRKKISKSFITRGMTIVKSANSYIGNVLGKDITKGEAMDVVIKLQNKEYPARINHVCFSESNRDCFQLYWKSTLGLASKLKEIIENLGSDIEFNIFGEIGTATFIIDIEEQKSNSLFDY